MIARLKNIAKRTPGLPWLYGRYRHWQTAVAFRRQFRRFNELEYGDEKRFTIRWEDRFPCLDDATSTTHYPSDYVYHTAWAARILAATRPEKHVDVSSLLYFGTIISAFVPVDFYDYRPVHFSLDNYTSGSADLLHLPFPDKSIRSLSCMHVVEHIGLGRYGDPLDPDGDLKAIQELKRVLAVGGNLLFVVPVGKPRIEFNAHRIYSYDMIMELFGDLTLVEFSLIPDPPARGGIIQHASREQADSQCHGCGCFWFRKFYAL